MDDAWGLSGGLVGFLILFLDIIVFMEIFKSNRDIPLKLLWALIIFLFPLVGVIVYFIFADRSTHNYESIV